MRTIEGETRSNPGPHLRIRLIDARSCCYVPARFFAALTRADWKFPTFLLCRNNPSAVSMSVFHALLATTPWVSEPASLSDFHCFSAHLRYGPYSFGLASFRAGIDPLSGLNVSCALWLPRKASHWTAAARCGAPFASVKLSDSQS